MCGAKEQLAWAFNAYYLEQNKEDKACDFRGKASVTKAAEPSGSCASVLSSASASATAAGGSEASASASASKSKNAGASLGLYRVSGVLGASGAVQIGLYSITAVGTGLLMVLL